MQPFAYEKLSNKHLVLAGLSVAIFVLSLVLLCLSPMWGCSLRVRAMQSHLRAPQLRLAMSHARRSQAHTNRQFFLLRAGKTKLCKLILGFCNRPQRGPRQRANSDQIFYQLSLVIDQHESQQSPGTMTFTFGEGVIVRRESRAQPYSSQTISCLSVHCTNVADACTRLCTMQFSRTGNINIASCTAYS